MAGDDWQDNGVALIFSILGFVILNRITHILSLRYIDVYNDFDHSEQGDWCSRVSSTIHSIIIVPGLLYTFTHQKWDNQLLPTISSHIAEDLFSFSCGYFLFDIFVILHWQVPMWKTFVTHHTIAMIPYLIYNFHPGCDADLYLLSLFLLVEFAVIPMNIGTFLEQLGYGKSLAHTYFFYLTYITWFFARVTLPMYNVYILWAYFLPTRVDNCICIVPAFICGHIIAAFCIGVFFFIWTPDLLAKWRSPVIKLEEYDDYTLTYRQTNTPRRSPTFTPTHSLTVPHDVTDYGSYSLLSTNGDDERSSYSSSSYNANSGNSGRRPMLVPHNFSLNNPGKKQLDP